VGSATLDFVIRARSFFFNKLIQIVSVEAINVKQHDGQIDAADKLYLFVLGIAPLAARHGESAKTDQNCTKQTRWKASMLDQVPRFKHQKKKKKNQQSVGPFVDYHARSRGSNQLAVCDFGCLAVVDNQPSTTVQNH
jgi:hypothetical protein